MQASGGRVAVVSRLDDVVEAVRRLASSAGVELLAPGEATASLRECSLLLVGEDVEELPEHCPAPAIVVAVAAGPMTSHVWGRATALGVEHVALLPEAEEWLVQRMIAAVEPRTPAGRVLGVTGGAGGAGASTLACGVARAAAESGSRCLLVDADALGGGLDVVLGTEFLGGPRWPDLVGSKGSLRPSVLYSALPRVGNLSILSWDRGTAEVGLELVESVLDAARHAFDVLVLDIPRHAPIELAGWCDRLLLVSRAQVRAAVAASQVARKLTAHHPDVRLVVRGPLRSGLDPESLAESLGLELAGFLPSDRGLGEALDRGQGIPAHRWSPLVRFSEEMAAALADGEPAVGIAPGGAVGHSGPWPGRPVRRGRRALRPAGGPA